MQDNGDRKFCLLLYPDSESYNYDEVIQCLNEVFFEYAYILHDKDIAEDGNFKKPHVHVVGRTRNVKFLHQVANNLNIPVNFVTYCKKWRSACRYLIHLDDYDKFQYDASQVISNFDYSNLLELTGIAQGKLIMAEIVNTHHSVTSLMQWSINNGCYSQFVRGFSVWNAILHELYGGRF